MGQTMTTWTDPRLAKWEGVLATLPPVFREMIDPDMEHRDMARPIVSGGRIYATNGSALVGMPITDATRAAIGEVDLARAEIGRAIRENLEIAHAPAVPLPDPGPGSICDGCEGAGHLPDRECDECDGGGEDECACCGSTNDCEACDGSGSCKAERCPECHGEGFTWGDQTLEESGFSMEVTPGFFMARHYIRMLRRHGVTEVAPAATDPEKWPAIFVVGEIEGGVMPVRVPKERRKRSSPAEPRP